MQCNKKQCKIAQVRHCTHPWFWILWKPEHAPLALNAAQTQQPWKILSLTGQAETQNPVRNCHSWDKEHQLVVWPALPAENPAINTSLFANPSGWEEAAGGCARGAPIAQTGNVTSSSWDHLLLSAALKGQQSRPEGQVFVTAQYNTVLPCWLQVIVKPKCVRCGPFTEDLMNPSQKSLQVVSQQLGALGALSFFH